jgi:hypothetical protein
MIVLICSLPQKRDHEIIPFTINNLLSNPYERWDFSFSEEAETEA